MSEKTQNDIKAIRHELQGGEDDLAYNGPRSLKYYVRDIHRQLGKWLSSQGSAEDRGHYELSWALGLVGIIGVLLAFTRSAESDIEWVKDHTVAFRLWAVVFCTIFIGVSIERSAVVRSLWSFTSTKFLISVILSGVVLYSRGNAAAYVNGVFHVDASALPITLVFTTGLLIIKLVLPFVLTVALVLSLVHGLISAGWIKGKLAGEVRHEPPFYSVLSVLVSGVILYFGWSWSHDQIADSRVPEKVYLMANALDFSYSHECSNIASDSPVVFLGAAQEAVLVAPYKLPSFDFAEFFEKTVSVPTNFYRSRCEYKSQPVAEKLEFEYPRLDFSD
ncbi:hypothetical protein [Pseudomonas japonica]|uniref:Uncharacterized protein n=1 Tax=Pseudomonas japonica TaxID=256466 RepID=A0A239I458_9PSED|nr:hypothetical protein [Pseudomonas japonica]SNS88078.1 hypothetical protein SAMN05444352_11793 [Pseudomonas japonica]